MIAAAVRSAVYDHVYAHADHEVGGVLVGAAGAVTASIPALDAVGKRASVTFTHESWAKVHERLERDFPEDQIVGWYHSHPGFGVFLSAHDRFIHEHFFSGAYQVAVVIDPVARTTGVFGWRDRKLVALDAPGHA